MNFNTITYISNELNKNKVLWAVGGSVMLYFHGLVESPNDLDILVAEEDIEKVCGILNSLGEMTFDGSNKHKEPYLTKYFYKYKVKDVEMDVMAGLNIKHDDGMYELTFDNKSIVDYKELNGVYIPLTALEDWYVLYQLMVNREQKVKMIEEYLLRNEIKNMFLLKRALRKGLPKSVSCRINKLLA